ncbi:MAG: DNA-binding response regulator [Winogradskyella sp.]|uniref:LytR/AlgR family response regulator transcription factor n=1 Tax=Winogradskyella sp. TaxID=1883156 RepID=UPI000F3E7EF8|nr:LytTR family DNA-binding domain-containing protein [Winogradskyella sp.]RNC85059.1 MAG: DNA-binding response regulator [Winogradskyella sp.]
MNIVAIDDNPNDLSLVNSMLIKNFGSFIEQVFLFEDPVKAIDLCSTTTINLIILDIEMAGLSGLEFLEKLTPNNAEVIFSTSHQKFALDAFKNHALGFLLKPYSESEFVVTVTKAINFISNKKQSLSSNMTTEKLLADLIIIRTQGCTFISKIHEILRIESVNNYAKIYMTDGSLHLSSYGIGHYASLLKGHQEFYRVHKAHIINLLKVRKYFSDGTIVLENGDHIPVARRRRFDLIKLFNAINSDA